MKLLPSLLFSYSALVACSLPSVAALRESPTVKQVVMPAEVAKKVIIKGNLISLVRNPFTGTYKGISMMKSRGEILGDPLLKYFPEVDAVYRDSHSIDDLLDDMGMPAPVPGNVEYLIDGKAFFTDITTAIEKAEKSVDTRVYIFDNDDVAAEFADLIKKKSKTVQCRVLMDELGSIGSWWENPQTKMVQPDLGGGTIADYLTNGSRVKVRKSRNPWLVTDHSKLFVIDRKTAYLGGMNIGREYRYEWHDMMVKVTGPAVISLQNEFNRAWRLQGGWGDWGIPFHHRYKHREEIQKGEIGLRILQTKAGQNDIEKSILAAVRMSKKRVYLQNPYFTSDALLRELLLARQRGVDIRMVFPEGNHSELLRIGNQTKAKQLVEAGARAYMYQTFSHIKAVVVDDWVCVGSANFDALSFKINEELNVAFSDKKAADRLVRDLFIKDFETSKQLTREDVKGWGNFVIENIVDQF